MPDGSINVKITAQASGFVGGVNQSTTALTSLGTSAQTQTAALNSLTGVLGQSTQASTGLAAAVNQSTTAHSAHAGAVQQATQAHSAHASAVHNAAGAHAGLAHQIEEATEHLQGMLSPITGVVGGMKEMGEVLLAAFAVEKIVEFVKEIGELAEKTENTAAAIGVSAEKFSLMSSSMALVGGNADTASRAMILLQTKLVEGIENPASKAREAFLAMGISLEQMKAGMNDLPGLLSLMADGFVRMGEGAGRTAAFRDLLGRMFQQLVPYLKEGAEGIAKFNEAAEETRAPLSEDEIARLSELGRAFNRLGQDLLALHERLVLAFAGPLQSLVTAVSEAAEKTTELLGPLRSVVTAGGELVDALSRVGSAFESADEKEGAFKGTLDDLKDPLEFIKNTLNEIADIEDTLADATNTATGAWARFSKEMDAAKGPADRARAMYRLFFEPVQVPPHAPRAEYGAPIGPPIPKDYKPPVPTGPFGGEGERTREHEAGPVNDAQERKRLEEAIKKSTDALKEYNAEAERDKTIAKGNNDDAEIERIEQRKNAKLKESIAERQKLVDDAAKAATARGNPELGEEYKQLGAGLKTEDLDAQRQQEQLKQQINERAYRDFAANEKKKVVEAKNDAAAILAIYKDWAAQAATVYHQPAPVITGIETEGIKASQAAQQKNFNQSREETSAARTAADERIAINKSENDIKVALHQESKAQAIAAEQQFTEVVLAEVAKRAEAELAAASTDEQRIKAYQDIARADETLAEKIIADQAKITEAVAKQNEKQVAIIKEGFDQIGKGAETAFQGLIDGQQTVTQTMHVAANGVVFYTHHVQSAWTTLSQNLLKAAGNAASGMALKFGEQFAAKGLASLLHQDVAEGETPTISGVLSKAIGGLLGLDTKPPKTEMAKAGEAAQKAADAQGKAAELQQKASQQFADAVDKFGGKGGAAGTGTGAPDGNGATSGAGATPGAPATGQYADTINAAAAQYNVPPQILYNLIGAESGFNPKIEGPPVASRGGARAKGLGQFMPEEAQQYGVDVFDPTSSIQGAAHYLSDLHDRKGSWTGALGAYSAQGPSLSGYAAQHNSYGPGLVAAANAADSGTGGSPVPVVVSNLPAATGTSTMPIGASPSATPAVPHENVAPSGGTGNLPPSHTPSETATEHTAESEPTLDLGGNSVAPSPVKTGALDLGIVSPAYAEERPEFEAEYQRRGAGQGAAPPLSVDLEQIAGSTLSAPGTTSGGGLPVSSAAPPSAETPAPAVPIPAAPAPELVTGLSAPNASPGGDEFSSQLASLGPQLQSDGTSTQANTTAVQAGSTAADAGTAAAKASTTAVGDNTTASKALTQALNNFQGKAGGGGSAGNAGGGEASGSGSTSSSSQGGDWSSSDVPAYADGGVVAETGLATVHAGEIIVPASAASDFPNYLRSLVAEDPNRNYGSVLPFSNLKTAESGGASDLQFALPETMRSWVRGGADLMQGAAGGQPVGQNLSPDAINTLLASTALSSGTVGSGTLSSLGRTTTYTQDQLAEWATRFQAENQAQLLKEGILPETAGNLVPSAQTLEGDFQNLGSTAVGKDSGWNANLGLPLDSNQITTAVSQGVGQGATEFGGAVQTAVQSANKDLISSLTQTTATLDKFKLDLAPPTLAPPTLAPDTATATSTGNTDATKSSTVATVDNTTATKALTDKMVITGTGTSTGSSTGTDTSTATSADTTTWTGQSVSQTLADLNKIATGPIERDALAKATQAYNAGNIAGGDRFARIAAGSPIVNMDTTGGEKQYFQTGEQFVSMLQDERAGPPTSPAQVDQYMAAHPDLFQNPYHGADLATVTKESSPTTGYLSSAADYGTPQRAKVGEPGQWFVDYGRGYEPSSITPSSAQEGSTDLNQFHRDLAAQQSQPGAGDDIAHLAGGQVVRPQDLLHNQSLRDAYADWEANPVNRQQAMTQGENPVFDQTISERILAEQRGITAQSPLTHAPENIVPAATQALPGQLRDAVQQGTGELKSSIDSASQKFSAGTEQATNQSRSLEQSVNADQKLTGDTTDNTQATKDNTQALQNASQKQQPEQGSGGATGAGGSAGGGGTGASTGVGAQGDWSPADLGGGDWSSDVPGYAEGGPVQETGLALVHQGEIIIPADEADSGHWVSNSPMAGYANPFHPVAQMIAGFFGQPTGDQYRGLFGAADPTDPDDPRRTPSWSSSADDSGGDWSSADTADVAAADSFAPSLELGGVLPSALGGMVVSGGPQTIETLGDHGNDVGTPSTYGNILFPTPPPVVTPQQTPPSTNKLATILGALGAGAGLIAVIAGLLKKKGSADSFVGDGSAQGNDWQGAQWANTETGGTWQSDSPDGGNWSSALDSGAAGMVIPSAAGGMKVDDGKGGTIAIVHPNEMILPANLSKGIQGIINSGAGDMGGVPSADAGMVVDGDLSSSSDTTSSSNLTTSLGSLRDSNTKTQAGQTDNTQAINRLTNKLDTSGSAGTSGASGNNSASGNAGTAGALGSALSAGGGLIGGQAGQTISGIGKAISAISTLATSIPKVFSGISSTISTLTTSIPKVFSGISSLFSAGAGIGGAANSAASLTQAIQPVTSALTAGNALTQAGTALNQVVTVATTAATTVGDTTIVGAIEASALEQSVAAQIPKPFGFASGSWNIPDDMVAQIHQGEMIIPADYAERLRTGGGSLGQALGMMVGRNLPHFELGAYEIAHDMAGFLHRGEQVIPANYADGLRAAGGSKGSGDVNLHYAPNITHNAPVNLQGLLDREHQSMLGWINAQMRSGALRPPPG